jgi:nucleoside-diphosphate-sugar epimerase
MAGHDFVIHIAGLASDWGPFSRFYETNVKGTFNVLKACLENGIRDIIITGTNAVYGEEDYAGIKSEASPFNSHYPYFLDNIFPSMFNHYRNTKALATRLAETFAQSNGLNLTVLEPVWVFGEREKNTGFYEYLRSVRKGMLAAPGSRRNKFHVVYAGDLADAYYAAYQKRLQGVNRFLIGNPKADKMDLIWSHFCREAGMKKPVRLPKWTVYPLAFCLELLYTILKKPTPPLLTRGRVNMFYDNIEYSIDKAKQKLGFACAHTLEQGIQNTVNWYKSKGHLS